MTIPSFSAGWVSGAVTSPRIYILEVRKSGATGTGSMTWLVVERVEHVRHHEREKNAVVEANIELHFEVLRAKHERDYPVRSSFLASYHAVGGEEPWVSLTSHS